MNSPLPSIVAALLIAVPAGSASGQSLFNAAGLGLPAEALDGRARALGNLGIGLTGGAIMPSNPGALARLGVSSGIMAGQPSWVEYSGSAGETGDFQGNRFPLLGLAYPAFDGMMSVQVGSFLDQRFESTTTGSVSLDSGNSLETTDLFVQDGSVSNINLTYARFFGDDVSAGLAVGRYAGSLSRTLTRSFGDGDATNVDDYVERGMWSYTGYSVAAGVSGDVTDAIHAAASVVLPTKLDADASDETGGADRSFDLPIQYRVGASATVGSSLILSASGVMADWSAVEDDLRVGSGAVGNGNGFGVGVELTRARLWGKDAPLRFGFRRTGLPFSFDDEQAYERVFSGGFGLALNTTNEIVLAGVDLAIERGRRSGAGVVEEFWRATLSLLAAGF